MNFYSTRNTKLQASFEQALFQGLAPDGGLYVPSLTPDLSKVISGFSSKSTMADIGSEIASRLFAEEMSAADARAIAERAFPFEPKLVEVNNQISILELFHGPSCAFKDFGASFLASAMEYFLQGSDKNAIILTATSGDTGSAVAQAFYKKKNIDVVILYPSGRVSPSQEKQLTTLGENIHALEVQGSFDDCQRMVKEAFVDERLRAELPLTSANSINLGRLLPQSLYYLYASSRLPGETLRFCVPSGNFGNLTAGVLAWKWGMPADGFIAATNANKVVPEYLKSGVYAPKPSLATPANAMDVGSPSNFERLSELFGGDLEAMRRVISAYWVNDDEILTTMKRFHGEYDMFVCPHTAVGLLSAERYLNEHSNYQGKIVTLATAHPAKFTEVSKQACGSVPEIPQRLAEILNRQKSSTRIGPQTSELSSFLRSNFSNE